jgi:hypothetical protein
MPQPWLSQVAGGCHGSVFGAEAAKAALVATLPDYVREYGDSAWGVVDIPVDSVKRAVLADEELASSFSSWKDYPNFARKASSFRAGMDSAESEGLPCSG